MWLGIEPFAMLKRMCPPPAPRSRASIQRQINRIGNEIGMQQESDLFAMRGEIIRLAVEAVFEVVRKIEDELGIVIQVHDRRPVGDSHIARGVRA
jgi:hypothetical protein